MRMVFAHFPITINISNGGKTIEIRNFIGEKHVKKIDLFPGCIVKKSETPKDQLELEGIDLENVSLSCKKAAYN
jgi:large subunit ribosomal protein L9e